MLTLPLEPTDDRANPLFKDAASGEKWLEQLQLTDLKLAHSLLLTQIDALNLFPMRGQERLNTLELLRDTVHYVQGEYAKKLIAKPLPLNDYELIIFIAITQLWRALARGYQRCLQTCMAGDRQLDQQVALLCHRCLLYSGLEIAEHLRTGYEFDAKLWHQLHELYAYAETQQLHLREISHPLNSDQPQSSCHNVYVKTLLTCYARPAELTRSQRRRLETWLSSWSGSVTLKRNYTVSKGDAQPLALDLSSSQGLQPIKFVVHSGSMRYLATMPLSKLLRVKTILLQQGKSPRQLELGDRNTADECIELMTFLHQCWCEDNSTRLGERTPSSHLAQLCYQPENIYALLSGKKFKQTVPSPAAKPGTPKIIEDWQLENESILGAKLKRIDTAGGRLSHNQLVAVKGGDQETFILGNTTWVNVARSGELLIGIRYLPGTLHAISLHAIDSTKDIPNAIAPGFLLEAVPALKSPPSLIIPRNWFLPGRKVEFQIQHAEKQVVALGFSVERGVDYERVSFTLV